MDCIIDYNKVDPKSEYIAIFLSSSEFSSSFCLMAVISEVIVVTWFFKDST